MWPRLHGAITHFPIALTMVAALFEGLAIFLPHAASLRATARSSIVLAALSALPASITGLFLTRGEMLGHGALLYHHLMVWPSLAGLLILGAYRLRVSETPSFLYLAGLVAVTGLMAGAGYWGGEMILAAGEPVPADAALIAEGRQSFALSCADCHGDDAHGGEGPDLHALALSDARLATTIREGVKGEMPAFGKKYDPPKVAALIAYLHSLK